MEENYFWFNFVNAFRAPTRTQIKFSNFRPLLDFYVFRCDLGQRSLIYVCIDFNPLMRVAVRAQQEAAHGKSMWKLFASFCFTFYGIKKPLKVFSLRRFELAQLPGVYKFPTSFITFLLPIPPSQHSQQLT